MVSPVRGHRWPERSLAEGPQSRFRIGWPASPCPESVQKSSARTQEELRASHHSFYTGARSPFEVPPIQTPAILHFSDFVHFCSGLEKSPFGVFHDF